MCAEGALEEGDGGRMPALLRRHQKDLSAQKLEPLVRTKTPGGDRAVVFITRPPFWGYGRLGGRCRRHDRIVRLFPPALKRFGNHEDHDGREPCGQGQYSAEEDVGAFTANLRGLRGRSPRGAK